MNEFEELFNNISNKTNQANSFENAPKSNEFLDLFNNVSSQRATTPDAITESFARRSPKFNRGFGQSGDRVPSRIAGDLGFSTNPRTYEQDTAEIGAATELARDMQIYRALGIDDAFDREVEAKSDARGFDTISEPIFNFLGIGNHPIAGAVEELMLTSSPAAALRQAGIEFSHALGLSDNFGVEDEVRQTTFGDIFSGRRGDTALTMSKNSPYATAAAGFVFDVLLDPTTWFGFGLTKVGRGLGALDNAAGPLVKRARLSAIVSESDGGKAFRKLFMPNSLVKGLKDGEGAEEIAQIINGLNQGVEGYKPITREDVMSGGADFLSGLIRKDAAVMNQTDALRENILKAAGDMNEGELRLVGAFLDQPKVVDGLIEELKVDSNTKGLLRSGVKQWEEMFQKIFDAEEEVGLFDKAQFRANYSHGTEPVTEMSRAIVQKMFELRFGKEQGMSLYNRASGAGIATITDNGIMNSSYAKKYPTLESRIMDLVNTETNAALMATRRGMQSIRKVNTQKFYDGILSDTRIAVPIDQRVALDTRDPLHDTLNKHGMKIWKAPALSTRKAARQASGDEQMYYALPAAMVDQLDDMTKIISGKDESNVILKTFREVQGLWKAYALMSPGYHMRNLQSNIFNNYLAGVTNPKAYAEAMLLQVEDTALIGNRKVRSSIEKIMGGRKTVDNYMFTLPDGSKMNARQLLEEAEERGIGAGGMIFNESDLGIGKELMTSMEIRTGRAGTTEISEGLRNWGNRKERIAGVASSMLRASTEAGANLTPELAQRNAEMYDVVARAWAWENWKTPDDWYNQHIRQIRAYDVPTAGPQEESLNFLHQRGNPFEIIGANTDTPEFKKAFDGAYAVDNKGNPIRVFHGSKFGAEVARDKGFNLAHDSGANRVGKGLYLSEDITEESVGEIERLVPTRDSTGEGLQVVSGGYSLHGIGMNIVRDLEKTVKASKKLNVDLSRPKSIERAYESIEKKRIAISDKLLKAKKDVKNIMDEMPLDANPELADMTPAQIDKAMAWEKRVTAARDKVQNLQSEDNVLAKDQAAFSNYEELVQKREAKLAEYEMSGETPAVFDGYLAMKNPFVLSTRGANGEEILRYMEKDEAVGLFDAIQDFIRADIKKTRLNPELTYEQKQARGYFDDGPQPPDLDFSSEDAEYLDDIDIDELFFEHFADLGVAIRSIGKQFTDPKGIATGKPYKYDALSFYDEMSEAIEFVYREAGFPSWQTGAAKKSTSNDFLNLILEDMGFDGLTHADSFFPQGMSKNSRYHQVFVAFDPNLFKSSRNRGTWDLTDNDMLAQKGKDGIRGAIQFLPNGKADILATKEANATTFIHEMAHLVRRTMLDEGDKDIIHRWMFKPEEYNKLKGEAIRQAEQAKAMAPDAVDVDELSTELMERFAWTVEAEEYFAKSFEQFIMEGVTDKNVGQAMQGTFDYMKKQFQNVYDFSEGGKVGIKADDDVAHVMERVLGRGVEDRQEDLATARAILKSSGEATEDIVSRAHRKLGDNVFTRANRAWGERLENNARLAHYITMRTTDVGTIKSNGWLNKKKTGRGMSAEEAAQSVKRFLFDYGELTPFERDYMKTVIPFYTWMRKNIPLQFQQLYENPERYSRVPKAMNEIEGMSHEWEGIPEPDYFAEMNAVRLPFTSSAIPLEGDGMPAYLALDLPYGDLNRLNMKDMVSSMTPFLKMWAEIYPDQGYSFFLDSEIEAYSDEPASIDVFDRSIDLGMNQKTLHAVKTLLPPIGKGLRLVERMGEGKVAEQLGRELLGINVQTLDVDAVKRAERFKRRDVSNALKARLIAKAKLIGLDEALDELRNE